MFTYSWADPPGQNFNNLTDTSFTIYFRISVYSSPKCPACKTGMRGIYLHVKVDIKGGQGKATANVGVPGELVLGKRFPDEK